MSFPGSAQAQDRKPRGQVQRLGYTELKAYVESLPRGSGDREAGERALQIIEALLRRSNRNNTELLPPQSSLTLTSF